MTEPVIVLGLSALALAVFSFVLARIVPDEYDRTDPRMILSPQPIRRRNRHG